jgi:hypothetical protein
VHRLLTTWLPRLSEIAFCPVSIELVFRHRHPRQTRISDLNVGRENMFPRRGLWELRKPPTAAYAIARFAP